MGKLDRPESFGVQSSGVESFGQGKFNKPDDATLRKKLTEIQYEVTQKNGTERAFNNAYWNNEEKVSMWILFPVSRFSVPWIIHSAEARQVSLKPLEPET